MAAEEAGARPEPRTRAVTHRLNLSRAVASVTPGLRLRGRPRGRLARMGAVVSTRRQDWLSEHRLLIPQACDMMRMPFPKAFAVSLGPQ